MIIYIEKPGLRNEIRKLGFIVAHLDGNPTVTSLAGVLATLAEETMLTGFISGYDPLIYVQEIAIAEIKAHTQKLIYVKLPGWKQNNLTVAALTLIAKPARGLGSLSQAELDQVTAIEMNYAYPLAVRAQSDIEEAIIMEQTDWALIDIETAKANLDAVV